MDKQVISIDKVSENIKRIVIKSRYISDKALPGQFLVLMTNEQSERIPLTIVSADKTDETITLIFQEAGFSTKELGRVIPGDRLFSLAGPLGHATHIDKLGRVILVGGGVGIAEIYPVAKAFKDVGNEVTVIVGGRNKDLLILKDEIATVADRFILMTDDGSYGRKGYTTDALSELLKEEKDCRLVYAVGPVLMMQRVAGITEKYKVKTLVSLNTLMVDGTGMCGCCRVKIGNEIRFACVDGPEFDAHEVDWQELIWRNSTYIEQEEHICRLDLKLKGVDS
ncbi:MAG: sulfide/dihydroorotate dehydrogenase-like FAD/NAD-binding protein [Candidatus Omnitrophica bacterium]|nr:sulfide/dihydroorotate dehydrogenase-like FAD/NAD-binding protein [Candidatus Omnitrophota bacterium]MDD5081571.1 sulfide/dihydroorotate dehydrogenase-like FAD/NAD-binding protein [Candidatus Omnitrophota bacterium]MDD5441303.1 sulfide/dihydroorotate dehydrogenase-like FAD/NAD-binding protein [Candidatus Omnitrophota bacterium]